MSTRLPQWPTGASSPQRTAEVAPAAWILEDPASQALLRTMEQVAASEAGVLILGDSGADK